MYVPANFPFATLSTEFLKKFCTISCIFCVNPILLRWKIKLILKCSREDNKRKSLNLISVKRMAPRVGLEPTTLRLTAGCSTIELSRNFENDQMWILPSINLRIISQFFQDFTFFFCTKLFFFCWELFSKDDFPRSVSSSKTLLDCIVKLKPSFRIVWWSDMIFLWRNRSEYVKEILHILRTYIPM